MAALLVFILGSAVTIVSWRTAVNQPDAPTSSSLNTQTEKFIDNTQDRFETFEVVLRGTAAFAASQELTNNRFSQNIDSLDVAKRYPSIASFGYVALVSEEELAAFQQKIQSEGNPSFNIFPAGKRDNYSPLTYTKSVNDDPSAAQLLGYDISTDRNLNTLLTDARESGDPRLSHKLTITNKDGSSQPGVALLSAVNLPSPQGGTPRTTGYVFMSIGLDDLFDVLKIDELDDMTISLYEGNEVKANRIITGTYHNPDSSSDIIKKISIAGKTWTVQGVSSETLTSTNNEQPWLILVLGIVVSGLLAGFLIFVVRNKALELDLRKTLDVQKAKENLLSLASHQLRTPATGVKQYVGMVLDGYAGEITSEQRSMLEKADRSNERQLSIVNQILKISKLENNRISLSLMLTDPVELTMDVISEQGALLHDKIVNVIPPEEEFLVPLDVTYFRMVIENLINNAAKYSHEGATITINFEQRGSDFILRVSDTGIGIEEENFPTLFEAFSRIDNEFTFTVSGTGIGLYINKLIVYLHEGTIDVESEVGVGTTFTVTIPMLTEALTHEGPK